MMGALPAPPYLNVVLEAELCTAFGGGGLLPMLASDWLDIIVLQKQLVGML